MAISLSEILAALQNGVTGINNLTAKIGTVFPQSGTVATTLSSAGTITFTSSQVRGWLLVTTSSGGIYSVPLY